MTTDAWSVYKLAVAEMARCAAQLIDELELAPDEPSRESQREIARAIDELRASIDAGRFLRDPEAQPPRPSGR